MSRLQLLLQSNWFIILLQAVFTTATACCLFFFIKEFIFDKNVALLAVYESVFFLSCGALFAICFLVKKPDFGVGYMLTWLAIGIFGFAALFTAVTQIINATVNSSVGGLVGMTMVIGMSVACIVTQDVLCFMRGQKFFLTLAAAGTLIAYGVTGYYSIGRLRKGWLFKAFSQDKITFATASYEEMLMSDEEKTNNKKWYEDNVLNAAFNGQKPAYDFMLGAKRLSDTLSDWTHTIGEEYAFSNGVGRDVTLTNVKEKVQATIKTVWYPSTATCEWTVQLKNVGQNNSAVVSSFYPISATFGCEDPTLYFSGGSDCLNNDFALYSRPLGAKTFTFDTTKGRTSETYLPFFNVSGTSGGFTVGLGWTGEWKMDFSVDGGVKVVAGQKNLSGYLTPGEEIRSPLVSLSLYSGNPLKGFNTFRQRILDSLPAQYGNMKTFAFAGAEGEANMAFVGEEGVKRLVDIFEKNDLLDTVDYAWFDAGWFDVEGLGEWASTVGDWTVDPRRYPNGLSAVSEYLNEKDIGLLLWYEPERIPDRSKLYQSVKDNENWLLAPESRSLGKYTNYIWNMGNEDANQYMCERIDSSIKENGVAFYRQDFNIDPDKYWEKGDKDIYDGRTGFCENKYVTGLYRYLDYLTEQNPGLLIDNCASGGRRIDLEMCRRSIPLWRSDYNCFDVSDLPEACQYQTYGLSLWLPLSNTGNDWTKNEYDYRSFLGSIIECYPSFLSGDMEGYKKFTAEYEQIKGYFLKNYYPLTPCTMADDQTIAMQFGDEKEGAVLVFSREKSKAGIKTIAMNGLRKNGNYTLKTIEGDDVVTASGSALMSGGFSLSTDKRTAYIIIYKQGE